MTELREAACNAIDNAKDALYGISREIWEHPEENYEEVHAHAAISDFLERQGFVVDRHFVVDTGFRTVLGSKSDGPHVALLCEYDALPEIGHACGHNLIAEVGLAAGIGVKAAFEANGTPLGKLTVLGTPAEEGGGGKIDMINAHVFDDVDVAMMAHPTPFNLADFVALAIDRVIIKFHGKASHASAFPWDGINALDSAVLCYQSISCMRQQCKPSWRIHGIIKNGGLKPNIIPELTELEYYIRTPTKAELGVLKEKLENCVKSAATASGCTYEVAWNDKPFYDLVPNNIMAKLYKDHATDVGVDFVKYPDTGETGSTDMGNVSYVVPSIHPGFYIGSKAVNHTRDFTGAADVGVDFVKYPDTGETGSTDMGNVSYVVPSIHPGFYIGSKAVNHTRDFTGAAGDVKAQPYTLAVAKAIAMTAIDIYINKDLLKDIKDEFEKRTKG